MFNLKFVKTIILAFTTTIFVISININIPSVKAQSTDLTSLQSELENLLKQYNQFEADLILVKEILRNELINNEKNKSDWLKPVPAGISTDQENETFISTYGSFQSLKNKREKFRREFDIIEQSKGNLSKQNQVLLSQLQNEIVKTNGVEITNLFDLIDQLGIIINPLDDGKLTPEELCKIQKTLGIIDTFNLTNVYQDKPNSCGYFFAVTHGIIKDKLDKETQKLKQNIENTREILASYSDKISESNKSDIKTNWIKEYSNWILPALILFLLLAVALIVILWQIIKAKSPAKASENNDYQLTAEMNSNNQNIDPIKEPIKKIERRSDLPNTNSATNIENELPVFTDLINSKNVRHKKLESSMSNAEFLEEFPQKTKFILRMTEETIDKIWKGITDNIEFEPDQNGEYLLIKADTQEYYLYFNEERKIRPEVLITCKKAGIFKIGGNVEYTQIKHISPAKVKQIKSENRWRLVQSGEVFFS